MVDSGRSSGGAQKTAQNSTKQHKLFNRGCLKPASDVNNAVKNVFRQNMFALIIGLGTVLNDPPKFVYL